ncbi:MAG: hypothetical protein U0Y68_10740 [Blastocatellia bacterium]
MHLRRSDDDQHHQRMPVKGKYRIPVTLSVEQFPVVSSNRFGSGLQRTAGNGRRTT